ncbi:MULTISPECIES: nuclear transport factor 2 family protein [unclassified Salinivibrio]|uniref:nuclear transport factor 2 family protein n=1 Tax=unclassified Salinivibrio TaxID=2636825 RepID=UPI00084C2569|nr:MULTISPECIES: nuclear transport factor 2 family protein [unclassified Salinivibrio]ODQ00457.1 polyketide cyclase [Salinivibrio sp. DV]PCE69257.1 nuclear transport factor 2 family protein [Salinivibrio sp. YCSC6]QCF36317.1 nuclear transport factor 2 family protein [Salinivibrio sp. YCSC6]
MTNKDVVLAFWEAMQRNDFSKASEYFSDDYQCFWPQSGELIVGRDDFVALNTAYPANGLWQFSVYSCVAEGDRVVTDVGVTDGVVNDRVITFHTLKAGRIAYQQEFWPDDMPAPEWRSNWGRRVGNGLNLSKHGSQSR